LTAVSELADRYVVAWCETGLHTRQTALRHLYAPDAQLVTASSHSRGLEQVIEHVNAVVVEFIAGAGYQFRHRDAVAHDGCVLLRWEMVTATADVADWGVNVLVLDADGRIAADHQFVAPWSDSRG
jgi:hypothetical protein